MGKLRMVSMTLVILISFLVAAFGCATATPTPTQTPTPTPTTKPTTPVSTPYPSPTPSLTPTPAKVFKFSLANQHPPGHLHSQQVEAWMDRMTKASNGQIQFNYFPSETLVKGLDVHAALQTGAVDISYYIQSYFAGQEPLNDLSNVPLLFSSIDHLYTFVQDPTVREIFARRFLKHNMVWLGVITFAPCPVISKDKPILDVTDWKGVPVRSPGALLAKYMQNAGASVLTISGSEVYTAAERGMIKAWVTTYASQFSLGLYEVSKYITDVNIILGTNSMFMNLDAFNTLPKDLQQLLTNESKTLESDLAKWSATYNSDIVAKLVEKGMVSNKLTKEQLAAWQGLADPLWKELQKTLGEDGGLIMGAVEKYRR